MSSSSSVSKTTITTAASTLPAAALVFLLVGQAAVGHSLAASNQKASPSAILQNSTRTLKPLISDNVAVVVADHPAHEHHHHQQQHETTSLSDSMLRTFIRTNNMRAYHLDLHSYMESKRFSGDPVHVDSRRADHQLRCAQQLAKYHQLIRSFKETDPMQATSSSFDSIRLADTFGRPEAGLLKGNQFWIGSYMDCQDFKLIDASPPPTTTTTTSGAPLDGSQYCLGVSQFPNWNPQDGKTSLKVGLCLPSSCTSSMLNERPELFQLVEQMMKAQFGADLPYNKIRLRSVYCLPHASSEVRQLSASAWALVGLLSLLVVACLLATVLDHINGHMPAGLRPIRRRWRHIIIESFSLRRNFDKLMSLRESSPPAAAAAPADESASATRQVGPTTGGGAAAANGQATEDQSQQSSVASVAPEPSSASEANWQFDRDTFFNVMSGLKCLGLFWIIFAHTFLVSPITDKNLLYADTLTKTLFANIVVTAHLMVDTFFALSGLLASYLIFKSGIHKLRARHWLVMTLHRYWRLTPIYLLCYWFTKALGKQLGEGPYWDYGTAAASPRYNCEQESWWVAVLHLSDFKSPKQHCIPFSWFIANGIKFWILTPLFLLAIYKSVRRGYALALAALVANMALVAHLAKESNVDMKSVIEFRPECAENMLNNMDEVYTRPYSRIAPYLVGLLTGHLVYLVDTRQLRVSLSRFVNILIWTAFTLITVTLTFLLRIANGFKVADEAIPWIFGISSALQRPLWAVCTCWLVFALAHGQVRWLARFLSANFWRILVKISFCAYLAQGEVIAHLFLGRISSDNITYLDLFTRPILTIILTTIVSTLMVLFIEYPLIGIEELLLPPRRVATTAESGHARQPCRAGKPAVLREKEALQESGLDDSSTSSTSRVADSIKLKSA